MSARMGTPSKHLVTRGSLSQATKLELSQATELELSLQAFGDESESQASGLEPLQVASPKLPSQPDGPNSISQATKLEWSLQSFGVESVLQAAGLEPSQAAGLEPSQAAGLELSQAAELEPPQSAGLKLPQQAAGPKLPSQVDAPKSTSQATKREPLISNLKINFVSRKELRDRGFPVMFVSVCVALRNKIGNLDRSHTRILAALLSQSPNVFDQVDFSLCPSENIYMRRSSWYKSTLGDISVSGLSETGNPGGITELNVNKQGHSCSVQNIQPNQQFCDDKHASPSLSEESVLCTDNLSSESDKPGGVFTQVEGSRECLQLSDIQVGEGNQSKTHLSANLDEAPVLNSSHTNLPDEAPAPTLPSTIQSDETPAAKMSDTSFPMETHLDMPQHINSNNLFVYEKPVMHQLTGIKINYVLWKDLVGLGVPELDASAVIMNRYVYSNFGACHMPLLQILLQIPKDVVGTFNFAPRVGDRLQKSKPVRNLPEPSPSQRDVAVQSEQLQHSASSWPVVEHSPDTSNANAGSGVTATQNIKSTLEVELEATSTMLPLVDTEHHDASEYQSLGSFAHLEESSSSKDGGYLSGEDTGQLSQHESLENQATDEYPVAHCKNGTFHEEFKTLPKTPSSLKINTLGESLVKHFIRVFGSAPKRSHVPNSRGVPFNETGQSGGPIDMGGKTGSEECLDHLSSISAMKAPLHPFQDDQYEGYYSDPVKNYGNRYKQAEDFDLRNINNLSIYANNLGSLDNPPWNKGSHKEDLYHTGEPTSPTHGRGIRQTRVGSNNGPALFRADNFDKSIPSFGKSNKSGDGFMSPNPIFL